MEPGQKMKWEVQRTEDIKVITVCDEDMESDGRVEHQEIMIR